MTATHRQIVSALAVFAILALMFVAAVSATLALYDARVNVANLDDQSEALRAREKRLPGPAARDLAVSSLFEARTITQAGAALQQRIEAAIGAAKGRLVSSKADIESRSADRWITLAAELTIAEPDLQGLLFDVETGRPYLFVEAFEAKAPDVEATSGAVHVSLTVSGQWGGSR